MFWIGDSLEFECFDTIKRLYTTAVSMSNSPRYIDRYCVQYIQQRGIHFWKQINGNAKTMLLQYTAVITRYSCRFQVPNIALMAKSLP